MLNIQVKIKSVPPTALCSAVAAVAAVMPCRADEGGNAVKSQSLNEVSQND